VKYRNTLEKREIIFTNISNSSECKKYTEGK
jgi:hypothetical protein